MTEKQEAAQRQDYWQEEARRYAQNAEFWRGKYEAATAQQQEPVAYASDVEFDDETEIIPAEQKGKLGTAGLRIPLYIKPPASKPWVGLTQQDIDIAFDDTQEGGGFNEFARAIEAKLREKNAQPSKPLTDEQRKAIVVCFTSGKVSVSEVQRKLAISYNEAQQLCQSIVDLKLAQGLQLAPSLDRHGIKGDA